MSDERNKISDHTEITPEQEERLYYEEIESWLTRIKDVAARAIRLHEDQRKNGNLGYLVAVTDGLEDALREVEDRLCRFTDYEPKYIENPYPWKKKNG